MLSPLTRPEGDAPEGDIWSWLWQVSGQTIEIGSPKNPTNCPSSACNNTTTRIYQFWCKCATCWSERWYPKAILGGDMMDSGENGTVWPIKLDFNSADALWQRRRRSKRTGQHECVVWRCLSTARGRTKPLTPMTNQLLWIVMWIR